MPLSPNLRDSNVTGFLFFPEAFPGRAISVHGTRVDSFSRSASSTPLYQSPENILSLRVELHADGVSSLLSQEKAWSSGFIVDGTLEVAVDNTEFTRLTFTNGIFQFIDQDIRFDGTSTVSYQLSLNEVTLQHYFKI